MYHKILVALENGRADDTLVPHIAELARRLGSELLLVHVADGWAARNFDQLKLAASAEMKADQAYLDSVAARLRSVIDRERPRDEPVRPSVPTAPAPREIPYGEEEPRPDQAGKLLSPSAQASVASSFQALAATTSHETIDSTVREMLRPMLTQWLDDNLPSLVERLVRAEIERVARGGR